MFLKSKSEATKYKDRNNFLYYLKRDWQLYALVALPLLFVLVFKYASYTGLLIAFKDYKVTRTIAESPWVGFDVFKKVFSNRNFVPALRNTLLLNILDLIFSFPMPIVLALILNELRHVKFKKISQTILYLPHFLSWVIIGAIALQLFSYHSGVINTILANMGLDRVPFLENDLQWLVTYLFIGIWQSMGWGTIIYLAAITSVNPELYEAATVDGCGKLKKCWHVTLPCIRSTIVVLLIMNLGKLMGGSFERIMALSNPKATEFTTTIPVLVYRWGIESGRFSESTALGLFQSIIGVTLVIVADLIAKKLGEDGLI